MQIRVCLLLAALSACCGVCLSTTAPTTQKTVIISIPNDTQKVEPSPTASKPEPASNPVNEPATEQSDPVTDPDKELVTEPLTELTTDLTPPTTPDPTPAPTPAPPAPTPAPPAPTPAPPAPTPAPPAPTPAPGPPEQGTWSYTNKTDNVTCVLVQFAAQLQVTYAIVNTTNQTSVVILNVPKNASVADGSCAGDDQFITLSWPVQNSTVNNTMTLSYHRNQTTKMYGIKTLEFALSPALFVNATTNGVVVLSHGCDWEVPLTSSYRCTPPSRVNLTASVDTVAALTLSHLQEEAYRTTGGSAFNAGRDCGGNDVPDAVPIAVGCALSALVIVVLVAYLSARWRSQTQGYLSM